MREGAGSQDPEDLEVSSGRGVRIRRDPLSLFRVDPGMSLSFLGIRKVFLGYVCHLKDLV